MIFIIGITTVVLMWHSLYNLIEKYLGYEKPLWFKLYFLFFMFYSAVVPLFTVDYFIPGASKDAQTGVGSAIIIIMWSCFVYFSRHLKEKRDF